MSKKLAVVLALAMTAATVFAQAPVTSIPQPITDISSFWTWINKALGLLFGFLLILSIGMMLYAAFQYLTSKGDPAKISSATSTIVYAAVGLAVAVLSKALQTIIPAFFGV